MGEIILNTIVLLLVIFGISDVIRQVTFLLLCPKKKGFYLLVPVDADADEVEINLRCALSRSRWLGKRFISSVIAVDCGMNEEAKALCGRVFRDCGDFMICGAEKLPEVVCNSQFTIHNSQ